MSTKQTGLMIGAAIGAILGAGTAYLLMTAPLSDGNGEEHEPISGVELIGLTGALAITLRKLDDIRRRI